MLLIIDCSQCLAKDAARDCHAAVQAYGVSACSTVLSQVLMVDLE